MFEQTKALCRMFLDMGIPGFDLIVYHNGQCALRHLGGYADREKQIPMQGKEKFYIYSCSKLLTCVAAMQLWEQGKFSLEDKISDTIPEYANVMVQTENGLEKAKNPILIRHLFQMTAGMTYERDTPALREYYEACGHRCPTVETVRQFAKTPLAFHPGEGWKYSLCHDVLAALVEILSGEKFEDYVKAHIFDPLGMVHSTFLHPVEDWEGFAQQYNYDAATEEYRPWQEHAFRLGSEYVSGGASCVSTVEDYIKFLEALRSGKLLKPETLDLLTTPQVTEAQYPNPLYSYGLGMRCPKAGSPMTDFGWGGHAGAYLTMDRKYNFSFFYVQHAVGAPNNRSNLITGKIKEVLEGK
jgi:CubicO group peptidase (beta-lactamase class C family)